MCKTDKEQTFASLANMTVQQIHNRLDELFLAGRLKEAEWAFEYMWRVRDLLDDSKEMFLDLTTF